jgi:hypothetical protein
MMKLDFDRENDAPFKILCLGAHSDDIEISCGGTLLKLMARSPMSKFGGQFLVRASFGSPSSRESCARADVDRSANRVYSPT